MYKLRTSLAKLPPYLLTIITAVAILWLTLAPQPTLEVDIPLFPGFDKFAHALMFGFLLLMLFTDRWRKHQYVGLKQIVYFSVTTAAFGLLIEVLQLSMNVGRSFEWADWIADSIGTITVATAIYIFLIKERRPPNK